MTAIEVVAVLLLLSLIVGVAYSFQHLGYSFLHWGAPQAQAQEDLRGLLDHVTRDARQARSVVAAGAGQLQLRDLGGQIVRYWLDGETARRQRGAEPAEELARGVTGLDFSYQESSRLLSVAAEAREEGERRFALSCRVQVRNQP